MLLGALLIVINTVFSIGGLGHAGTALIVAGLALYFVRAEDVAREPVTVRSPVRGRWLAINSPASRVPSHGTRELGQAYAIDLVYQPDPLATWRGVHRWPPALRPHTFPAFGQPIIAPADGVVVAASGWQRDHLSRNSVPGLVYLVPEMLIRGILSLLSGFFVIGNHIVLDLGDGVYARPGTSQARLVAGPSRRPGPSRAAIGRVRQLGQYLRTTSALPADGSPVGGGRRRSAVRLRPIRDRREGAIGSAGQQRGVHC
jgi:hypothetical protein